MNYVSFKIEKEYPSILNFLKEQNLSKNFIIALKKNTAAILVNSYPKKLISPLLKGDVLEIEKEPVSKRSNIKNTDLPLEIVYEDIDLLAVNKPANIVTIPSKLHNEISLAGMVLNYYKNLPFTFRPINRLDKEASGLVLIAKNQFICEKLFNCISEKNYFAIVCGQITKLKTIKKNILTLQDENKTNIRKRVVDLNGKSATTHVEPIKNFNDYTLCKIKIENGRTHQIRVHLSSISHPLLGDSLYGQSSNLISRTALHLYEITLIHPISNHAINLIAPFPNDILSLINWFLKNLKIRT